MMLASAVSMELNLCIEECVDTALINAIMTHPKIYPFITHDESPSAQEFDCSKAIGQLGTHFLTPVCDGEVLGVFMVHMHTPALYEVHTCLLPAAWGEKALAAARACREWIFTNTTCRKLITWVPETNKVALRFALRSGMQLEGCNKKSFMKGGVLLDQHLLGMMKD